MFLNYFNMLDPVGLMKFKFELVNCVAEKFVGEDACFS
jgi:hypothetical protein